MQAPNVMNPQNLPHSPPACEAPGNGTFNNAKVEVKIAGWPAVVFTEHDLVQSPVEALSEHWSCVGSQGPSSASLGPDGPRHRAFLAREALGCQMAKAAVCERPMLANPQALISYLQIAMGYEQVEQFRILFLDRKNKLIAYEVQQLGTVDDTPVRLKTVVLAPELDLHDHIVIGHATYTSFRSAGLL